MRARLHFHARGVSSLERLRVLIADDRPVFRRGLRTRLPSLADAAGMGRQGTEP
jgi:hypothetical protein